MLGNKINLMNNETSARVRVNHILHLLIICLKNKQHLPADLYILWPQFLYNWLVFVAIVSRL